MGREKRPAAEARASRQLRVRQRLGSVSELNGRGNLYLGHSLQNIVQGGQRGPASQHFYFLVVVL